jgi:hypothetical protein
MTPARKLAYRRVIYIVAMLVSAFVLMGLLGTIIPEGAISPVVGTVLFLVFIGYFAYFIWIWLLWKPICPGCRMARARFVYPDKRHEHLVCPSCGFDEPTGFEKGGFAG